MPASENEIDQLIGLAYEGIADIQNWQRLVERMDQYLDGAYVHLHAHDQSSRTSLGLIYARHPDEFVQSYFDYYGQFNPITPHLGTVPEGKVLRTDQLLDWDELRRTEYYNEWMLPQEDSGAGCGAVLLRDTDRLLIAGIHLPAKTAEAKMARAEAMLERLSPHLIRAMNMRRELARSLDGAPFRAALDSVADAVFHLDRNAGVVWMNAAAEGLCGAGRPISVDTSRRLRTGNTGLDERLSEIARARYARFQPIVLDCRVDLGSMLVGHALNMPSLSLGSDDEERGGVTTVTLRAAGRPRDWQGIVHYFALTAAEAGLADDMVHGMTLEQCAARRGTSIHTVRNQLRSLLAKTSTNRQPELVALLAPFALPRRPAGSEVP